MNDWHEPVPLLEVDQLGLHYGGVRALDGLSFSLAGRGLWGVMGANGAGKSSLFNVISGLAKPTSGTLRFLGEDVTGRPAWQMARRGLARTFQNIRLLRHLSVRDNLLYAAAAAGEGLFWSFVWGQAAATRHRARMAARADRLLHALGLWGERHQQAVYLPYGMQRRLEIGRSLMLQPRLVLLDEPAAGMNASEKKQLAHMLPQLLGESRALIIEHDLSFLLALCHEVLVLHQGSLLARGTPAFIRDHPMVHKHYLGI